MRVVIIGGVAAGTSAAAKIRRNDENAEICIYEAGDYISYSTCGMPYMIGRDDVGSADLLPRDPLWFKQRFFIDIKVRHFVQSVDASAKRLSVKNLETGRRFFDNFDKLVFATGSRAILPPIDGIDAGNVFTLKTMEQSSALDAYIAANSPKTAAVIGSGFIGLEIFENLYRRGIEPVLVEARDSILPALDRDMSFWIQSYMDRRNLRYRIGERVVSIDGGGLVTASGERISADLVVVAAGVRPESRLAEACGAELDEFGAIAVDSGQQTSLPDIYAAGDCASMSCGGRTLYRPLGSTANKTGRIAGDVVSGGSLEFRGVLGTGILKFFDLQIGMSGLSGEEAERQGLDCEIVHCIKENQSKYLAESREMVIKAAASRADGRLLGVQIVGEAGVDKRLDVFAAAMSFGAAASDLTHLDLAYAPPFSTTKDPVHYTGMIIENALYRGRPLILPAALLGREGDFSIIDVRSRSDYEKGHIEGAVNIPLAMLRERLSEIDRTAPVIVHCNKGVTGNAAQNLLLNKGFEDVRNISGGYKNYSTYKKYYN